MADASELGVWVARIPCDAAGNADSVAELAVLQMLALTRRLGDKVVPALAQLGSN